MLAHIGFFFVISKPHGIKKCLTASSQAKKSCYGYILFFCSQFLLIRGKQFCEVQGIASVIYSSDLGPFGNSKQEQ